jgi:hypothetical protein
MVKCGIIKKKEERRRKIEVNGVTKCRRGNKGKKCA